MLTSKLTSVLTEKRPNLPPSDFRRLDFLDRTRGLIMLFMALDHALFFWSNNRINNEGLPLLVNGIVSYNPIGNSNLLALLVMVLSSLCAPGFLFIAGYVLALSIKKRELTGASSSNINHYLLHRGILLIFLQIFVASPAFNLPMIIQAGSLSIITLGTLLSLSILSTFGISFLFLMPGRRISPWKLVGIAGTLYLLSQLSLSISTENFSSGGNTIVQALQNILILPVPFSAKLLTNNNFPVIPWFLPFTLGWLYGHTFNKEKGIVHEAKRFAFSGAVALLLFLVFRLAGIGDHLHPDGTLSGFLGLSKYPPSPDYFLLYLGLIFLLLFAFSKLPKSSPTSTVLETFGKTPLFFYNLHLWLYAAVPALINNFNGYSLIFGIGIWLLGLIILYPLCRNYLTWKSSNKLHLPHLKLGDLSYIRKGLK